MKTLRKIKLACLALVMLGAAVIANRAAAPPPAAARTKNATIVFTGGVFSIGRYSLQAAFTPDGTSLSFSLRNADCG